MARCMKTEMIDILMSPLALFLRQYILCNTYILGQVYVLDFWLAKHTKTAGGIS